MWAKSVKNLLISFSLVVTTTVGIAPGASMADASGNYQRTCAACHNLGVAGAPKLGDPDLWNHRIDKGIDTLVKHAIEGFAGDRGVMPPKGGFKKLSDEEVRAIVEYMVSTVK